MIIPRFTVRRLLLITAIAAVFFGIVSAALRGARDAGSIDVERRVVNPAYAAAALSVGIASVGLLGATFSVFFLASWIAAQLASLGRPSSAPKSPFAQHTPAPQLLPPDEPP